MSMAQSYKVFVGGSSVQLQFDAPEGVPAEHIFDDPTSAVLLLMILQLESHETPLQLFVVGQVHENWKNFCSHFTTLEAAGGLVQNAVGDWLFIYRNGMWDLPKGKLEKGESIGECAVREVAEECGITKPTIVRQLATTYHTYTLKGQRILKPTYWFLMKSTDVSELIPQTEEGITEVKWVSTDEAHVLADGSFGSIRDVVTEGLMGSS